MFGNGHLPLLPTKITQPVFSLVTDNMTYKTKVTIVVHQNEFPFQTGRIHPTPGPQVQPWTSVLPGHLAMGVLFP